MNPEVTNYKHGLCNNAGRRRKQSSQKNDGFVRKTASTLPPGMVSKHCPQRPKSLASRCARAWRCSQHGSALRCNIPRAAHPRHPSPLASQVCYPVCTETGNVRMVERCGAFKYIMQPGLSFVICCVDGASSHVSMRLQQIKVTCETKTKDNVFTNIEVRLVLGARRPCAPHRSPRGGSGQRRRASQSQACPPRTQAGVPFYSSRGLLYRALPPIVSRLAGVHPVPDQKGGGGDAQCLLPPLRSPPPDPGVRV